MLDTDLRNDDTPSETGAPALHSTGLALARVRRGEALLGDLLGARDLNKGIEAGAKVELYAEDLVRGYRVDVWDGKAPGGEVWRSLHERITTHTVDGLPDALKPVEDEGYIKATAAASEREDHPAAVGRPLPSRDRGRAGTAGASSAPRPGKRVVEPGEGPNGTSVDAYDPAAGKVLPICRAAGSSPRACPGCGSGIPTGSASERSISWGTAGRRARRSSSRHSPPWRRRRRTSSGSSRSPSPTLLRRDDRHRRRVARAPGHPLGPGRDGRCLRQVDAESRMPWRRSARPTPMRRTRSAISHRRKARS